MTLKTHMCRTFNSDFTERPCIYIFQLCNTYSVYVYWHLWLKTKQFHASEFFLAFETIPGLESNVLRKGRRMRAGAECWLSPKHLIKENNKNLKSFLKIKVKNRLYTNKIRAVWENKASFCVCHRQTSERRRGVSPGQGQGGGPPSVETPSNTSQWGFQKAWHVNACIVFWATAEHFIW